MSFLRFPARLPFLYFLTISTMGSVKVLPVPLEPAFEKRLSSVSQDDSYFAFARIRGELQVVQGEIFPDNNKSSTESPLSQFRMLNPYRH